MAHKAVEMKRSERSDAEIQLSKQVVQTFPKFVAHGLVRKFDPVERTWGSKVSAALDTIEALPRCPNNQRALDGLTAEGAGNVVSHLSGEL